MHDLRFIRECPEAFDNALKRRGLPPAASALISLDGERRFTQTAMQEIQAKRNDLSKQIGEAKRKGDNVDAIMKEVASMKDNLAALEEKERELGSKLDDQLSRLPNMPGPDVPDGKDENDNKEVRRIGEPKKIDNPKQHFELGEALGLMDIPTAAKLSGARFTLLRGPLARLERALGDFMLNLHTTEFGYTEISPPLMVRDEIAYGTGNLPKFAEDLFQTTVGLWLIPTAEVPLTNMVNGMILNRDELPIRVTARTPCFRSEAGSAGKDTRGMLRQHQFYKVELVSIVAPDKSLEEHERMTSCAETVLKRLELPFRTITLCAGDMGFSARKTYDIEVFLPGQNMYREISSCSNCWDFQARRMQARCRAAGEKNTEFVHTLNGSGIAIGRALIAVMENYQNPDGSISIPAALRPYMGGLEKIEAQAK
ncbi:MAG: serine--tRNA ligase [Alphaproteobacteria bacterium]|nr:serine--tRNA ligase [Alphaproteobacteria bacterium]